MTGAPSGLSHLGNTTEPMEYVPGGPSKPAPELATLEGLFDLSGYPTPFSDIVAMLVLEHRNHMTNLLVRIGWEARVASHPQPSPGRTPEGPGIDLADTAEELVDYLLFVDEAPLPAGLTSTSGFAERFSAEGPFDSRHRSLHQLDLGRRLLRYPCSPLIYAAAFDALPADALEAVYARMWDVLSGAVTEPRYEQLSREDRRAIVEILRDTKTNLPAYFQGDVS